MLPYLGMIFGGVMGLYHMMAAIGQEGIVFDLILLAGSMVTLVFGVTYVLTFFYMTNDTETLLPLPLSPWQIIGAKFTVVFVYECFTNLLLVGPAIVGYGVAARWGIINWIMGILQFFFLPIMPLVYAGILSILLMKIFHRIANRNFISVLSTVLMLVIVFGMSALGSSMGSMDAEKMVELMTEGGNSLVGMMGGIFPLLSFGSKAAVFGSFLDLLIVLLGNAAAVAVFLFVGQKLYFSGVLGMNETSSKRRKISYKERQKLIKGNSPLTAYIGKEWKLLVRTPVYFLNCALFPLIWPVFFCVPVVISLFTNGVGEAAGEAASQITPAMIQLLMEQPMTAKVALLIVFGITVFIGSMGFVSGTAISREGTGFIFMKYIPVPYRTQLLAKLSVGMILTLISTTGYILIALIIMVILGFPPLAAV